MKTLNLGLYLLLCCVLSLFVSVPARAASTITYIHNDVAGTPIAASTSTGTLLWKESYYPYGEQIKETGSASNDIWFHGKTFEDATGLSYFGARYYDPILGRFMGIDPVGVDLRNVHSFNRYAYGNNNPNKFLDPNGKNALKILQYTARFSWAAGIAATKTFEAYVGVSAGVYLWNSIHNNGDNSADGGPGGESDTNSEGTSDGDNSSDMVPDKGRGLGAKAPNQITPTGKDEKLTGQYVNDKGQVQPWEAHYDKYGRQVERTDSDAGNSSQGIPDTHHHTADYGPGSYDHGPTRTDHVPGPGPRSQ